MTSGRSPADPDREDLDRLDTDYDPPTSDYERSRNMARDSRSKSGGHTHKWSSWVQEMINGRMVLRRFCNCGAFQSQPVPETGRDR